MDRRPSFESLPRILVTGSSRERGRQLGEAASDRIYRAHGAYREIFEYYGKLDWSRACAIGRQYREAIREFDPRYIEEMQGIAEGTGLEEDDLLALNARTEILARLAFERPELRLRGECTSFGFFPRSSDAEPTLIGQNWDWLDLTRESLIVLEAEPNDGPSFVTIVEAGLLAKCGMNAAGVGLATNALLSEADRGAVGVPYHVLLRAVLDSTSVVQAIARLQGCIRASSANYLIGQAPGVGVNVEATAGDCRHLAFSEPQDGLLLHTNHFIESSLHGSDMSLWDSPDSVTRLARLRQLLGFDGASRTAETLKLAVMDHAQFPTSICTHVQEDAPRPERWATLASVIFDLPHRRIWLASGNPCQTHFAQFDYQSAWDCGPVLVSDKSSDPRG